MTDGNLFIQINQQAYLINKKIKPMKKTNPTISYDEFYNLVKPITQFKSVKGNVYSVISVEDSIITFLR